MRIVIDFDNILNNLTEKVIETYNKQFDKSITVDEATAYNFYDCLQQEDADGIMKLFKTKSLWDSLTPIEGSRECLKRLINDGHKVYIATATAPENFSWKISWMKKYFPFFDTDNIIRIIDKSLIHMDVLIEDNIEQLARSFTNRICLSYPWNKNNIKDYVYNIYRCNNWEEILEAINKIEEEIKSYE